MILVGVANKRLIVQCIIYTYIATKWLLIISKKIAEQKDHRTHYSDVQLHASMILIVRHSRMNLSIIKIVVDKFIENRSTWNFELKPNTMWHVHRNKTHSQLSQLECHKHSVLLQEYCQHWIDHVFPWINMSRTWYTVPVDLWTRIEVSIAWRLRCHSKILWLSLWLWRVLKSSSL